MYIFFFYPILKQISDERVFSCFNLFKYFKMWGNEVVIFPRETKIAPKQLIISSASCYKMKPENLMQPCY